MNRAEKKQYRREYNDRWFAELEALHQAGALPPRITVCPKCGGAIRIYRNKNIPKKFVRAFFYGCSNYPKCSYTNKHYVPLDARERYRTIRVEKNNPIPAVAENPEIARLRKIVELDATYLEGCKSANLSIPPYRLREIEENKGKLEQAEKRHF